MLKQEFIMPAMLYLPVWLADSEVGVVRLRLTFGEAALNRIGNQNSGFRRNNPLGSNITGSVD